MQIFDIEVVYRNYKGLVCSIVKKYISNQCDLEECVSDVFLKAFLKKDSYSPDKGSLKSWIATLAKNHSIDFVRMKKNKIVYIYGEDYVFDGINETTYNYNIDYMVDICLSVATSKEKLLLEMFYFEKKKHKEISLILGVKTNAVGTMIKRTTTKINKRLEVTNTRYNMAC